MVSSDLCRPPADIVSREDLDAIETAIAHAEEHTNAEIIVVLAKRSGRYDRTEDLIGLGIAIIVIAIFSLILSKPEPGGWDMGLKSPFSLGGLILVLVVSAVCGTVAASRVPWLVRRFVPRSRLRQRVRRRGAEAFRQCKVSQTQDRVGLLIYISLFERTCWVAGDRAVEDKVGPDAWNNVRGHIVTGFRKNEPWVGLRASIEAAAQLLAEHFPKSDDDTDELPNHLHFLP